MHYTEILIDKQSLDLYEDKALKYKIQTNKIASPSDREASFMPLTAIPKTAKNTRLLQGLGIPSDLSNIPYVKPNCELRIDGFSFISKGWIGFEESNDEYKVKIYSGIVQFFKRIEGKTLGNDLDLSAINHVKTLDVVKSSFTNPSYRYLIGDYNGKTHYGTDDKTVNIDYLVPSVNVAYLWDLIHKTFGFTYSGTLFSSAQFNNLWITYPKPIEQPVEISLGKAEGTQHLPWQDTPSAYPETWYRQLVNGGFPINSRVYKAPKTGKYRLKVTSLSGDINVSFKALLYSINQIGQPFNGRASGVVLAEYDNSPIGNSERVIDLSEGDEVDFYTRGFFTNRNGSGVWDLQYDIEMFQIDTSDVDFSKELSDFSITDFVKDQLNLFGMTPFSSETSDNIDYKLITERYSTAEVVDWSKKYVKRKGETYVFNSFSQQNFFRYQYNDKESDFHDGSLNIPNLNLKEKSEIFKSKMYSPEKTMTRFYLSDTVRPTLRVFKMYDKTVKESGGQTKIEYKSLDKRFHYCRSVSVEADVTIGSEVFSETTNVTTLPVIDFTGLSWVNLLTTFYYVMGRVMIDSRVHEIELNLDPTDVILLDQTKMVYFEQEQQYYVIDSIEYDGDEIGVGRFVRVKRDPNAIIIPVDPVDPSDYEIKATWNDNTNSDRTGIDETVIVKNIDSSYPVTDPLVSYVWERKEGENWVTLGDASGSATINLIPNENLIRIKGTTQSGASIFSNTLRYFRQVLTCQWVVVSRICDPLESALMIYTDCNGVQRTAQNVNYDPVVKVMQVSGCAQIGTISHNGDAIEYGDPC